MTTPPTLSLDDLAAPTTEASVVTDLLDAPEFEPVAGVDPAQLDAYDLTQAVELNVPGPEPTRAMFRISGLALVGSDLAARPASVSITASSDPQAGRDALTIEVGDTVSRTVVDRTSHTAYRSSPALPEDVWAQFPESEVIEDTDAANVAELFDALITGPLTPDVLAAATVTPGDGLVRLGGGAIARRYDVVVTVDTIQPRGALMFAAALESLITSSDGLGTLSFEVYVTDQPALALVITEFEVDGEPRTFTQFFDQRPANVRIELPAAQSVLGGTDSTTDSATDTFTEGE